MNTNKIGRRKLIIGSVAAGLGTLFSQRTSAQTPKADPVLSAQNAGALHDEKLKEIGKVLEETKIISEQGLIKIVDYLVELGLISKKEGESLKDVVRAIFNSKTVEEMERTIVNIYEKVGTGAENIAVAIVGIARSSISYAKSLGDKIPKETLIKIVANDFQGAVSAASVAAKLPPPLRIAVIVGGAVSSSAIAAF